MRSVLRALLRSHHRLLWLVAIVAAGNGLLNLAVGTFGDPEHASVWEAAGLPPRVMFFVIGATITPLILPAYVAHGVTRRTFTAAASLAGLLFALAAAAFLAAGHLVERAAFAAAGRPHRLDRGHLFTEVGQVHLVLIEYTLLFAAYLVSGWLIGTAYYRFGGWVGTLTIPLGLVPAAAVENTLGTGWLVGVAPEGAGYPSLDLPVVAAMCFATGAVGLGGLALRALTRTLPVRAGRVP